MGILNVTPDSFSDGGKHCTTHAAVQHAHALIAAGADMIDIGGESTRPGSAETHPDEEQARILPVIRRLRSDAPTLRISVDTRHADTAKAALEAGADIINDITALADPAMRRVCAEHPCGIILMHMQGTPATMQQQPHYNDVVAEVHRFFEERIALAAREGISPDRICLDPGIGFGKSVEHNLLLIRHLESLRVQNRPLLMALSRKAFMGRILAQPEYAKTHPLPTMIMSILAADHGADLHRVHDVAELHQALRLRAALLAV